MCGIAGFQGAFDESLLGAFDAALAHRGPDGAGTAFFPADRPERRTGFTHRRLAIIDLSPEGNQPLGVSCPCCGATTLGELALIYNGEVYNYRELRAELESRGHRFSTGTDTEVLLHLYAEHGPSFIERLNGMFAFALRDGRERGRPSGVDAGDVLIARDPIGVKPLYLASTAAGTVFASELKALLPVPGVRRDLDPLAIHQTLALLWTPAPRTVLAGVRKLQPGRALLLRNGTIAREWDYAALPVARAPLPMTERELTARLREEVQAAVDRQLVSDVPVGAFLSGGLDSSAVVASMRRARPDVRPTCYCIAFGDDDTGVDGAPADLPYARRVAQAVGAELRELHVGPEIIAHLDRMLWMLDEPQADPAPINALLIAERARQDGIPVLLSGAGGDDLFSGYRRHAALATERYWSWLPSSARGLVAGPARRAASGRPPVSRFGRSTLGRRLLKALAHADRAPDARIASYFMWSTDDLRRPLLSPDLRASVGEADVLEPLLQTLGSAPPGTAPLDRMLLLEMRHFLADHNLNYTDKTGMSCGVEVRVPLLDLELVDFALQVPASMKQRGRLGKAILRRAFEGELPHEVLYRPKSGFGVPLRRWLGHELRDRVEDALSPTAIRDRGLFDPVAVRRLIDDDRAGRVDGTYTIFALLCLETWCRLFLDGAGDAFACATSPAVSVGTT